MEFDIRRDPRQWTRAEVEERLYAAPEKIEFVNGIFNNDRERLVVLGMILETMGIDRVIQEFGKLEDWKSAVNDICK